MGITLTRAPEELHRRMPANQRWERDQLQAPGLLSTADQSKPSLKDAPSWRDTATGQLVRWVLSTYELPERLAERLTWIAVARLEELLLTRFDDQYRYIDSLVDRFTQRSWEWRAVSLDAPAYKGSHRALHELIPDTEARYWSGDLDGGIGCDVGTDADESPALQVRYPGEYERALATLRNHLDPAQYEFVEHLLRNSRSNGCVCEPAVARNLEEIQRRLDELAGKYQVEGRIVFPPQPILHIRFHPLRIRFGRRPFMSGNPLRYWRRHRHIYRGLRRKELFRIDQGLYQALRAAGQLNRVIPQTYGRRSVNRERESACSEKRPAPASNPVC